MAALSLARRGVRTLLVDRANKGRPKVCGCCLGAVGQGVLASAGLSHVLAGATHVGTLNLAAHGSTAELALRGFLSISRESLDPALAEAAQDAGAQIMWKTRAIAHPTGRITVDQTEVETGVVIDATGLGGHGAAANRGGRIGLGMASRDAACAPGALSMAVAAGGYLGRVALPDGRIDLAMAATPSLVRKAGSPTSAARAIWRDAGFDPTEIPGGRWIGTPTLARRTAAQEGRILRVGDAAGYVEPFTGEGMSWALLGASAIADDAIACIERGPDASNWPATLRGKMASRHARCRMVSHAVRSPMLIRAAIGVASVAPDLGARVAVLLSGARRSPA